MTHPNLTPAQHRALMSLDLEWRPSSHTKPELSLARLGYAILVAGNSRLSPAGLALKAKLLAQDAAPAPMADLTPAQRRALQRAVDNNGTIEIGGLDGDPVSRALAFRLYQRGLLAWKAHRLVGVESWSITQAGRDALGPRKARSDG